MGIEYVLALAAAACAARLFRKSPRHWILLVISVLAIFKLQPLLPIRGLDFWLPTLTVALAVVGWAMTMKPRSNWSRPDLITGVVVAGVILILGLSRLVDLPYWLTASRPPQLIWIGIGLLVSVLITWILGRSNNRMWVTWAGIGLLILILLFLKNPELSKSLSTGLRQLAGQDITRADALDIRWLGFSYVAFRLIHTIRDRQSGKTGDATLREYLIYVIFFPTIIAGPIDRIERFIKDLRAEDGNVYEDLLYAGKRLALGILKKFVLADGLALMALNAENAGQVQHTGWMWVMLYAYAFQIFLDFSGYTDIAIGLGRVVGIKLPENFQAPYLKTNLTQFWNNWHITLTQWFRGYFFNPLTRAMRRARWNSVLALLLGQISTMVLIGMWHGVTWNFIVWGLWHGMGLFVQNRWSDWVAPHCSWLESRTTLKRVSSFLGVLVTFHYVAIGWVWFVLPTSDLALKSLSLLFRW